MVGNAPLHKLWLEFFGRHNQGYNPSDTGVLNKNLRWSGLKDIKTPTREGIGSIVQKCGIRNGEFLSLTTPRTIGDATRLRARVSCRKKLWNMTKLRNYYLRSNSFCYRALVEWRSRRHGSNSQECVWPCRLDNNALAYQKTGLPQKISSWLPQSQEWGCSPQGPPCSCRWDRVRLRWQSTGRCSLFLGHRSRRSRWRWVNSRALLLTRWSRWRRSQRSQRCFWKHCLHKELLDHLNCI